MNTDPYKNIFDLPLDQVPQYMEKTANPGSPTHQSMSLAFRARLTKEAAATASELTKNVVESVSTLGERVEHAARSSDETGKKVVDLNRQLMWATWAMVALTVGMLVAASFQAFAAYMQITRQLGDAK